MSEEKECCLTIIEKRILQILALHPERTAKTLAEECDISARTVERYLKALQLKGKLQRVGANKGGRWRVC